MDTTTTGATMSRSTVASLSFESSIYNLYDLMATITHLSPSFHPSPSENLVHVKVETSNVEEAKKFIGEWQEVVKAETAFKEALKDLALWLREE